MPRLGAFARFFSMAPYHNQSALTTRPLQFFIHTVPSPTFMMQKLQQQGHFSKQIFPESKKTLENYLQADGFNLEAMKYTSVELLERPFRLSFSGKTFVDIPKPYQSLIPILETYAATVVNVFADKLASRLYDPKEVLQENTTERGHGFQAFVMMHQLRAGEKNKLGLLALLHDIARATMADAHHGDLYHHQEADKILAPQGYSHDMATRYPLLHPFAKDIWSQFSGEYRHELLSPVSAYSLVAQKKESALLMQQLDHEHHSPDPTIQREKSEQLLTLVSRMMMLRLVDESAKVPMPASDQLLTPAQLNQLIIEQIVDHLKTRPPELFADYQELLRVALRLLRRTASDSNYSDRYQPLRDEEERLSDSPSTVSI